MKNPVISFLLLVISLAAPALAQEISIETGASLYGSTTPHFAGHLSLVKPLDDGRTFSITSFESRGNGNGQPVLTTTTGIAVRLWSVAVGAHQLDAFSLAQIGGAVSDDASSIATNAGGGLGFWLTPHLQIVATGQFQHVPASDVKDPLVTLGLRFAPGQ